MDCNYKWISSTVAPPIRAGFRSSFWKPSFSKAVNGTYYVVEAVPDTSKRTTYIVSAYMTKISQQGVRPPMYKPRRVRPKRQLQSLLVIQLYHRPRQMLTRKASKRAFPRPSRRCATLPLRRTLLNSPETRISKTEGIAISRNPTPMRQPPCARQSPKRDMRVFSATGQPMCGRSPTLCDLENLLNGALRRRYFL